MNDLSIFGATDEQGPGRSERRRQERLAQRRRRRRLGPVVALVIVGALVAGIVYGGQKVLSHFKTNAEYAGAGFGSVLIQVHPGDSATDIAGTLVNDGVIKSAKGFRDAAKQDARSTDIQPGYYRLHQQMSGPAALTMLLDPTSRVQSQVTVPEGYTVAQTLALVAAKTHTKLAALQAAARHPGALGLPSYAGGRLEGFLFPATYQFDPGNSATDMLHTMVATYLQQVDQNALSQGAGALGLTPYQMIIVASLVEREAKVAADGGKVARVIYNRLGQGFFLGVDASVLYGLGRTSGKLSAADLAKPTPYNTRIVLGLPPTPIANPGLAAIQAALNPTPGPWLYYVLADRGGHLFFTDSSSEFDAAAARCAAAGLC